MKKLEVDQQYMETGDFGPFELGVFPEFKYDLIGKNGFDGLGNKSGKYQVKGRNILMNSFLLIEHY